MNSTIIIGKKYKETVYKGVKKAVDVIKLTYGYNGKYVKIDNGDEFKNDITNDGYKVAQEIYSDDPVEDIGCGIVREATKMTEQKIKNGTTTTAILIGGLFEGMVELPNDINILEVKDSIEHLAGAIIGYGEDNGETANSEYDIAFNSCHDKEMAEFVVSVMEEHDEFYETSKHYSDEYQIEYKKDERNTSLQLLSRKDSSEIKNPYVVVYDGIVNNTNVVNFSDTIFSWVKGKDTVLIIKNIDKWSVNHISARMMTHDKDIMLFTTVDGKTVDFVLDFYKKQPVLLANKMLLVNIMNGIEKIDDKGTVYGKVFMEDVDRKINELKKQISEGHNDYNADIIRKKINNYMGRTYKISLKSNSYNFEGQKDKFLDAVNDIINLRKSSYKVVDGGGVAFKDAANYILDFKNDDNISKEYLLAIDIMGKALRAPINEILSNSYTNKNHNHYQSLGMGYNARNRKDCRMIENGIITSLISFANTINVAKDIATEWLLTDASIVVNNNKEEK